VITGQQLYWKQLTQYDIFVMSAFDLKTANSCCVKSALNLIISFSRNKFQSPSWEANSCFGQIFAAFYEIQEVINPFSTARYWTIFWARWLQSRSSFPISFRSTLILFFYLCLGTPVPSSSAIKNGTATLPLPHMSSWRSALLTKHGNNFTFTLHLLGK
jgi:hypothetical protein